jgi:hypothetical protein
MLGMQLAQHWSCHINSGSVKPLTVNFHAAVDFHPNQMKGNDKSSSVCSPRKKDDGHCLSSGVKFILLLNSTGSKSISSEAAFAGSLSNFIPSLSCTGSKSVSLPPVLTGLSSEFTEVLTSAVFLYALHLLGHLKMLHVIDLLTET